MKRGARRWTSSASRPPCPLVSLSGEGRGRRIRFRFLPLLYVWGKLKRKPCPRPLSLARASAREKVVRDRYSGGGDSATPEKAPRALPRGRLLRLGTCRRPLPSSLLARLAETTFSEGGRRHFGLDARSHRLGGRPPRRRRYFRGQGSRPLLLPSRPPQHYRRGRRPPRLRRPGRGPRSRPLPPAEGTLQADVVLVPDAPPARRGFVPEALPVAALAPPGAGRLSAGGLELTFSAP
jgi:hypothetical protein